MTTISETRCERTDLPAAMCSHCRGLPWRAPAVDPELDPFSAPAPPVERDNSPGPWFAASYAGGCSSCDASVTPGDWVRADGRDGYECYDCGVRR